MSWKKSMDQKHQKRTISGLDYELMASLDQWTVDGKMTLLGVRHTTARFFPWVLGDTWMWGTSETKKKQIEKILVYALRADLSWWHDGFFRLSRYSQDLLCYYLDTHPTGRAVTLRWGKLMAVTLIAKGLPLSTHPADWPPYAEDQLRLVCKDIEKDFQKTLEMLRGEVCG